MEPIQPIETNKPKPAIQSQTIKAQVAQIVTTAITVLALFTGTEITQDQTQTIITGVSGAIVAGLAIWGIVGRVKATTQIRGWFK